MSRFLNDFHSCGEMHLDFIAVKATEDGSQTTHVQLASRMERWCGAPHGMEIGQGEHVLILLPSSTDLISVFLACVGLGAVANPA